MGGKKVDEITIKITGNKRFRQKLVDEIYKLLNQDEIIYEGTRQGNGFTFNTTLAPSDEVME